MIPSSSCSVPLRTPCIYVCELREDDCGFALGSSKPRCKNEIFLSKSYTSIKKNTNDSMTYQVIASLVEQVLFFFVFNLWVYKDAGVSNFIVYWICEAFFTTWFCLVPSQWMSREGMLGGRGLHRAIKARYLTYNTDSATAAIIHKISLLKC